MASHKMKSAKSTIETIWGTTVGMIALLLVFLPNELSLAGAIVAIAGASVSTMYLTKHSKPVLQDTDIRKELEELKRSIAELQIQSADESLKKQIEELTKKIE